MHGGYLGGIHAVVVDHCLAGEVADRYYVVGMCHAVALYAVDSWVGLASGAVVLGGVHVDYQRLTGHLLGVYAGRICEPVVAVDNVEVEGACEHACHYRVVVYFFEEVGGIFAGELYAA